jgi:hypothetical protein
MATMTYDEVYTNKLLERLQSDTSKRTLAHVASEALGVRRGAERLLILVVGLDLFQFGEHVVAVSWQATEEY